MRNFFKMIEAWAVFKSNRQQSGELLHFAQRFVRKKVKKSWQQIEIEPPHLVYLPRLETYAENLNEYRYRRELFENFLYGAEKLLIHFDNQFLLCQTVQRYLFLLSIPVHDSRLYSHTKQYFFHFSC